MIYHCLVGLKHWKNAQVITGLKLCFHMTHYFITSWCTDLDVLTYRTEFSEWENSSQNCTVLELANAHRSGSGRKVLEHALLEFYLYFVFFTIFIFLQIWYVECYRQIAFVFLFDFSFAFVVNLQNSLVIFYLFSEKLVQESCYVYQFTRFYNTLFANDLPYNL